MAALSWVLEATTTEAENEETHGRVRGARSRLRRDQSPEAVWRPTLQPTTVTPSSCEVAALHWVVASESLEATFVGYTSVCVVLTHSAWMTVDAASVWLKYGRCR